MPMLLRSDEARALVVVDGDAASILCDQHAGRAEPANTDAAIDSFIVISFDLVLKAMICVSSQR
jgi:hypothetical protein